MILLAHFLPKKAIELQQCTRTYLPNNGECTLLIVINNKAAIFKNFNWKLITLQYCGGFAIH